MPSFEQLDLTQQPLTGLKFTMSDYVTPCNDINVKETDFELD